VAGAECHALRGGEPYRYYVRPPEGLPWPASLDLCLEREAEKSSDNDDAAQKRNALERERCGDRRDDIRSDQQLQPEQDAATEV
jgi:hypothetical protein